MTETAAFDPGIGALCTDFNTFINEVYSKLMDFHSISQKRAAFRLFDRKIYNALENNIAFFYGCLLWAYYLKKEKPDADITGNVFLNMTHKEAEEYDYLMPVSFIENYFDSYERDTHYYTGKKTLIPDEWKRILSLYTEFLELNKGFVNTKNVKDLSIPSGLKFAAAPDKIKGAVNEALDSRNLSCLMNIKLL